MSWLFSRALVEAFSEGTSLAGKPCAQLNVMPTQHKFWRNDRTMEPSLLSQFGLTLNLLTENLGAELLISCLEAFRAKTSAHQVPEKESLAHVVGFGQRWRESSVRYCLSSCSWRTANCLWEEALPESSVTLPTWGITRRGVVYQHRTAVRPMSGIEHGLWPTVTVADSQQAGGMGCITKGNRGVTLHQAVRLYPTLLARDHKSASFGRESQCGEWKKTNQLPRVVGGLLNPSWTEWFMGWPIGWTELKPLEMAKFQEWQQQHSGL